VEKYFPPGSTTSPLVGKHTMALYDPVALERLAGATSAVVVAVLRDPVPRAHSHYRYARLRGWEDAPTFEEGLAREPGRPRSAPPQARDLHYVGDGTYAPYVRDLFALLPPERRRVYLADDLRADPAAVCAELFELAGLPPHRPDTSRRHNEGRRPRSARFARAFLASQQPGSPLRTLASRHLSSRTLYRARSLVNRLNEAKAPVPPMRPETATLLRRRFAEPNAELADVLGRPLAAWAA
jgi:hypothetical protein